MPATPTYALRYPASTDPADVPVDMQKLASDVETALSPVLPAKPVVNGQWVKGVGGAAVWASITTADLPAQVGQNLVGALSARPAANAVQPGTTYFASDCGGLFRSDGTLWLLTAQRANQVAPGQMGSPPWSTPYDGMELLLVDGSTGPNYEWHFRYNAASVSAYKWECIGGAAYVYGGATTTLATLNTWVPLWGWVVPRAGDWQMRPNYTAYFPGTYTAYIGMGVQNLQQANLAVVSSPGGSYANLTSAETVATVPSGQYLQTTYYVTSASTASCYGGMSIMPKRIA